MGFVTGDRVKETTTTTGTGTITLAGAVTGYRTFASVATANGDTFRYCISSSGGSEWEVGIGTRASSTTFTRDVILSSSNSNAVVNLSSGTKDVFLVDPALDMETRGQNVAFSRGMVWW